MTLYVDVLRKHPPAKEAQARRVGERNGHRWCHLFCDPGGELELHHFAKALGMKSALDCPLHGRAPDVPAAQTPKCRCWFQAPPEASKPHYDLTPGRRAAAVRAGAVELDDAGLRAYFARWKAHALKLREASAR